MRRTLAQHNTKRHCEEERRSYLLVYNTQQEIASCLAMTRRISECTSVDTRDDDLSNKCRVQKNYYNKEQLHNMKINKLISCMLAASISLYTNAQHALTVKVNEPKADIQPTMWGIFFEDINLGADGGIYAELVKNRSFEFFKPMMGWTVQQPNRKNDPYASLNSPVLIVNRKEENTANPRFIRVTVDNTKKGELGLTNEGFRGMGIKKDLRYDFSVMYKQISAGIKLHVELVDSVRKYFRQCNTFAQQNR